MRPSPRAPASDYLRHRKTSCHLAGRRAVKVFPLARRIIRVIGAARPYSNAVGNTTAKHWSYLVRLPGIRQPMVTCDIRALPGCGMTKTRSISSANRSPANQI